jgi:ABC-type glycerol-3-phosphate transport system permease component
MLPLLRPPLGCARRINELLDHNDFFWALILMSEDSKRPVTSALRQLQDSTSPTSTYWQLVQALLQHQQSSYFSFYESSLSRA